MGSVGFSIVLRFCFFDQYFTVSLEPSNLMEVKYYIPVTTQLQYQKVKVNIPQTMF